AVTGEHDRVRCPGGADRAKDTHGRNLAWGECPRCRGRLEWTRPGVDRAVPATDGSAPGPVNGRVDGLVGGRPDGTAEDGRRRVRVGPASQVGGARAVC